MRSIQEIAFRLRQETANLYLLAAAPEFRGQAPASLALPDVAPIVRLLRGSEFSSFVEATAEEIMAHRFPLLGVTIDAGADIQWRRDYVHGKESGTTYFRRLPYLDFESVGDHKFIWELNRHQHLVLLAQAFLFTRKPEFAKEVFAQIESWMTQNLFQRGINWASALEVAFRALSWIWIYHLLQLEMTPAFRRRFLTCLYQHGRHLAENLSVYFSPNTHLLGEAVALHALGIFFPGFPGAARWRERAAKLVASQLEFQVRPDGSHFEQSTYYHVYAVDFFIFFYLNAGRPKPFEAVLTRMAEYLDWLLGPARSIACLGDDDGGRLFHPFGARSEFGQATLATCGILLSKENWLGPQTRVAEQAVWWLGADALAGTRPAQISPTGGRLFPDSGAVFLQSGALYVQFDAGPFGWAGAGHSHADTLSLVVWFEGEPVFIDPGTFTYIGEPAQRNWFRGTAAHNTVAIDGVDQAQPAGPFRWATKPQVSLTSWKQNANGGFAEAVCCYSGYNHRRRVLLEDGRLLVLDDIDGPAGVHACRQTWQLGPAAGRVTLAFSGSVSVEDSQKSPAYGRCETGKALVSGAKGNFPLRLAMSLDVRAAAGGSAEIDAEDVRAIFDRIMDQASPADKLEGNSLSVKGTPALE
jgi:Heparinase II/III-like protein/Heparinase II/III N-terminus